MKLRGWVLATLLVTVVSSMGCGSNLASVSAGHVGCSPNEISIADERSGWSTVTWTATCRGRRFQCTSAANGPRTTQINCAAADGAAVGAVVREERTGSDGVAVQTLRLGLAAGGAQLRFIAIPARDSTHLIFGMHPTGVQSVEGCSAGVMVDGELHALDDLRPVADPTGPGLRTVISTETLGALSRAERVSGRVCDVEWRLGPSDQALLRELLTRIEEDLAWQRQGGQPR